MRILEATEVGKQRERAERCAWVMAGVPDDPGSPWRDTVTVRELQRHLGTEAVDALTKIGLLIPTGLQIDLGTTHQKVRWLHRTVHENLVAIAFASMVTGRDVGWQPLLVAASLHYSWRGTPAQCSEYLGDSEFLHSVIDFLHAKVLIQDTPSSTLGDVLTLFARKCDCSPRASQIAKDFLRLKNPALAVAVHPETAIESRLANQFDDSDAWFQLITLGERTDVLN